MFPKSEQGGILLLLLLISALLCVYFFVDVTTETKLDTNSPEMVKLQREIDSLRLAELEARRPKIYPFNPNFITDYKAYTLGMNTSEYNRLQAFRKQDKWINSAADFKKITQVSDQWMDSIAPFFTFPEWITNPKPSKKSKFVDFNTEKSYAQKIDLNIATAEQLQEVSGIGEALSARIIKYREKLQGFSHEIQLHEVYGLSPEVVYKTVKLFAVKTPKPLKKLNVNTASASDLSTIPGVSFELAKEIWEFIRLREGIEELSELEKIESITPSKLSRIQLYLSVE
jgi:DNA uptake protein ComE-like DNA-binding protein